MSLKTWATSGVSADNAHGVIRPTGRSGCRRAPGPPESLAGTGHAHRGSARRLRLHVAEHRLAGGAGRHRTGCAVRRGGCRRVSIPRRGSARRRACSSSLARPARALAPTVEALPLMVCRSRRCPGHRPRRAGVRAGRRGPACPERSANTWTISSRPPPKRPTISPRASTSSPASAAVAGAPLAPLLPR